MGLFDPLLSLLSRAIDKLFEPLVGPIQKLFGAVKGFFTALIDVIPETITLVKDITNEVFEWKNFKQGISFKHGVINLQSVRDHIEDLINEIIAAWRALQDLFTSGFKLPVKSVSEAAQAVEEVVQAFEDFFGKFAIKEVTTLIRRLGTQLEKAGGKVFEVLAIIQAVAEEALKVVRELQAIVNAVRDVRQTFQTGEGLFLKQTNPRRTVQLAKGGSMKIRVGKLHS